MRCARMTRPLFPPFFRADVFGWDNPEISSEEFFDVTKEGHSSTRPVGAFPDSMILLRSHPSTGGIRVFCRPFSGILFAMKSMTGYGRGECSKNGVKFTVEVQSANRRQSDITIDLPRELIELEPRIRDEINTRVSRGRIDAVVTYHRSANKHAPVSVDHALARGIFRAAKQLQKQMKLKGELSVEALLNVKGVLCIHQHPMETEKVWPSVQVALQAALAALVKMREKEGRHLREDLLKRLALFEAELARVRAEAPNVVKRYQKNLRQRIASAGVEVSVDNERLIKEVVLFADRSDITEELTRLESHLQQFRGCLGSREPVGRTLDFLAQEMFRETNTLGAKANDAAISRAVVTMKAELEKMREQIQNVE